MKSFDDMRQAALPLLMEVPKPRRLDDALIDAVSSDAEAVRLCIERRVRRHRDAGRDDPAATRRACTGSEAA